MTNQTPPAPHRRLPLRVIFLVLAALGTGLVVWWAWRPRAEDRDVLVGYIQADNLYLSSPVAGPVREVLVQRGQRVSVGDPLFVMDLKSLTAGRDLARARIAQAQAQVVQQQA